MSTLHDTSLLNQIGNVVLSRCVAREDRTFLWRHFRKIARTQFRRRKQMHMLYPAHLVFFPCPCLIGGREKKAFSEKRAPAFGDAHRQRKSLHGTLPQAQHTHSALCALPLSRHCCADSPRPARGLTLKKTLTSPLFFFLPSSSLSLSLSFSLSLSLSAWIANLARTLQTRCPDRSLDFRHFHLVPPAPAFVVHATTCDVFLCPPPP